MRTTLKRGLGRGAQLNGKGRAVLPPSVLTPVVRYRQPQPRHRFARILGRLAVWSLVTVMTVAAGLAGGLYVYFHETADDIAAHTPELKIAQARLDVALPDKPAVALVVGYDQRAGEEADVNGARSDTVMLLRADPKAEAVSLLSFPRDLDVEIHCPDRVFGGRLNEAYTACGPQGTLETVRALTGLPIHYLITVNFRGFKQMVAKIGGVWMDIDRRYYNPEGTGYASIDLQPGWQKVNGSDALDFVRFRHTDSDIYRLARQQLFVQAFKEAFTRSFSLREPTNLPRFVGVIKKNLEIGSKSGNLSLRTLLSYGLLAYQLPQGHFFQTKIDVGCYREDAGGQVYADAECVQRAVSEFAAPDVEAPRKATDVALGRKPKPTAAPPPARTTVVVLNGNGIPGAAADTSWQLHEREYLTLAPPGGLQANAPTQSYANSVVYFDPLQAPARAAAAKLAPLLGGADVKPVPAEIAPLQNGAMLVVVVGLNYSGRLEPSPVDQTPERQPPAVVKNPDEARDLVRKAQGVVRFPLAVPTVLERTSSLDSEVPIRIYQVGGHRTVRLTFRTGANEYWGIQMIRWNRAPALEGPNRTLWLKGRKYELHYSGPKLHMVVARNPGGTSYWVVNTLLNSLSNETMLAIAKGLRPIP